MYSNILSRKLRLILSYLIILPLKVLNFVSRPYEFGLGKKDLKTLADIAYPNLFIQLLNIKYSS